uniref:Disease resistance protein At4g27190-like leucine-rich repeats domain-containing protein n=1 Tax=Oryza punctata TaxID=4537 RepID=A0A0E0LJ18_ORYPU
MMKIWAKTIKIIQAANVRQGVERIIPYLEDTTEPNQIIYYDGWNGLAASAVLRSLAKDPPPSLVKQFDNIIHLDCSRWKNQRQVQKEIASKVKLPRELMTIFDAQDEDDDFSGVNESSRAAIAEIARVINQALQGHKCLVVFHNGSKETVDLNDLGIPKPADRWSNIVCKILWTYRGRLRAIPSMRNKNVEPTKQPNDEQQLEERVDNSQVYLHSYSEGNAKYWRGLLMEEAAEMALYTCTYNKFSVTSDIVFRCSLYLLLLDIKANEFMDYDWVNHASNYWVCGEIIKEYGEEERWQIATAIHQQMRLQSYSSNGFLSLYELLQTPLGSKYWVSTVWTAQRRFRINASVSSLFLARADFPITGFTFRFKTKLRVLKLCYCSFSFTSPPFRFCHGLRFLGLNSCKDVKRKVGEKHAEEMEFFGSLWVLDICSMHWELKLPDKTIEKMSENIREVNIKKGCIWSNNLSWRKLHSLRKLRIIEPTDDLEISEMDNSKLELLDLSRNTTMRVLPKLSDATSLNTLILDGCIGLEHVGPADLPPSIETFSLDAGAGKDDNSAKISQISLAGCKRLMKLQAVPCLRRVILLGCEQLRAVLWPETGMPQLMVLNIDIYGGEEVRKASDDDSLVRDEQEGYCHASVGIIDVRSLQLFVLGGGKQFCWNASRFNLNLCLTSTRKGNGRNYHTKKTGYSSAQLVGSSLHRSSIPMTQLSYKDVNIDMINIDLDDSAALQLEPLDIHVEIGEGIRDINVASAHMVGVVIFLMNRVKSLHVHDNSSMTNIIPEHMGLKGDKRITWSDMKWCHIKKCPKLDTVFHTNYAACCFETLETFSADDLTMARFIWSRGAMSPTTNNTSFAKLQSIHLHSCPRLMHVLPLSWAASDSHLPSLETIHIVRCGELGQIFPVETEALGKISTGHPTGVLKFPNLKHIHLDDLPKLQQICNARRMFAPELKTIRVRGCWGLKRIPATDGDRPIVDCEKDWWEKLEWDGLEDGHGPSLFQPHHSMYYKKALPRGSVLS